MQALNVNDYHNKILACDIEKTNKQIQNRQHSNKTKQNKQKTNTRKT